MLFTAEIFASSRQALAARQMYATNPAANHVFADRSRGLLPDLSAAAVALDHKVSNDENRYQEQEFGHLVDHPYLRRPARVNATGNCRNIRPKTLHIVHLRPAGLGSGRPVVAGPAHCTTAENSPSGIRSTGNGRVNRPRSLGGSHLCRYKAVRMKLTMQCVHHERRTCK